MNLQNQKIVFPEFNRSGILGLSKNGVRFDVPNQEGLAWFLGGYKTRKSLAHFKRPCPKVFRTTRQSKLIGVSNYHEQAIVGADHYSSMPLFSHESKIECIFQAFKIWKIDY